MRVVNAGRRRDPALGMRAVACARRVYLFGNGLSLEYSPANENRYPNPPKTTTLAGYLPAPGSVRTVWG